VDNAINNLMSRAFKTKPLPIPCLFKDSAKISSGQADPFRAIVSDRLKLMPSCPSRRYGSTSKTRPQQENCPKLPVLRPTIRSAGPQQPVQQAPLVRVKKLFTDARFSVLPGSSSRVSTRFSGVQDSSSRVSSRFSGAQDSLIRVTTRFSSAQDSSSRVSTPYFGSRQSNGESKLSSASTAQSSSANSPGKDPKSLAYLARCLHYPKK
jgi:hypothetical protein